jgi:hypothetical protein
MIVVIDEGIAVMQRRAAAASPSPRPTLNYFAANLSKLTIILVLPSEKKFNHAELRSELSAI